MGLFPAVISAPGAQIAVFTFDTNDTAAPDGLYDPGGLAAETTPLSRAGVGDLALAIKGRWTKVLAWTTHEDPTAEFNARVYDTTEGSGSANAIKILLTNDDVAADSNNKRVVVLAVLIP